MNLNGGIFLIMVMKSLLELIWLSEAVQLIRTLPGDEEETNIGILQCGIGISDSLPA